MVVGIGVDIAAIHRIDEAIKRHGERFLRRVFTAGERAVCSKRRDAAPCFAARFAAKEAVMKALGCGWGPVGWGDIELVREATGRPSVRLHGNAARLAAQQRIDTIHISMSHERQHAVAYAIASRKTD